MFRWLKKCALYEICSSEIICCRQFTSNTSAKKTKKAGEANVAKF